MEERQAATFSDRFDPRAQRGVSRGSREQASRQRPVIEAGSADDYRKTTATVNVPNSGGRVLRVLRGRVLGVRIDDVDQMMRNAAALRNRDLIRADVEPSIDSRRIAVDDLAAVLLRERERQRAFSGGRRSEDRCEKLRSQK